MKTRAIALPAPPPNGPAARLQLALDSLLSTDLEAYRRAYAEAHGQEVSLEHLVPAILRLFLQRDRGFQKWKKAQAELVDATPSVDAVGTGRDIDVSSSIREPTSVRYRAPSGDAGLGERQQDHDPA